MAFDPDLEKYARADDETVSVRKVKDDREIAKIAINDVESSPGLCSAPMANTSTFTENPPARDHCSIASTPTASAG